jgi:hypothetical protein
MYQKGEGGRKVEKLWAWAAREGAYCKKRDGTWKKNGRIQQRYLIVFTAIEGT